jgi:ABC-2 type transport system ATP-binding protein
MSFYLGVYNVPQSQWKDRINWVLDMARLQNARNRKTKELPPGWRQRLALGCSLLHKPDILFLDEPTSGVDPVTRGHFWNFIKQLAVSGMTVFVTTHYMDEARFCERIVMLSNGNIVACGSPAEIIAEACPGQPDADLTDAFIKLMKRDET